MSPPSAHQILKSLEPERLIDLARILDVTLDGDDHGTHIDALLEASEMHVGKLADLLRRDELKQVCEANGIHVRGRIREDLVSKLTASAGARAMVADRARYAGRIAVPKPGDVIKVRRRQYFVEEVRASSDAGPEHDTLISLVGLGDDNQGRRLTVFWELELGARVLASAGGSLGQVKELDKPSTFSAYLNALRWSTVSATDPTLFQAPHRAGIEVMQHQMTALKKALELPRANLFIADDVGLGKTIEAGLVVQELMLRQRVDFVLIVCPASVCLQWREEMANRFGIQCEVYNRAFVSRRRQERGFGVNPWRTHNRFIISHQTLRQTEYLNTLLEAFHGARINKSLLILDEAHVAAPASESRYAVDSRITKMVREVAPLFKNRLFLSATPHNGHSNSFSALLEILDPQRFIRGIPVRGPEQLKPIMIRRLKSDLRRIVSNAKYPERRVVEVLLTYTKGRWVQTLENTEQDIGPGQGGELELARLLAEYTANTAPKRGKGKLVFINLQKRLLSSVEAFSRTLAVHMQSMKTKSAAARASSEAKEPAELDMDADTNTDTQEGDDEYGLSDETLEALEQGDNAASSAQLATPERAALDLCKNMQRLADAQRHQPDAKVLALLAFIRRHMCPSAGLSNSTPAQRKWLDRRLIIFTEYADTKRYLLEQLRVALDGTDSAEERVLQISGGMSDEHREEVQRAFCADYGESPVRILVATDAAREGLNLQRRCSDLFHFDIPWNPGRMEQRNGRIDRVRQPEPVVRCHYFAYHGREEDRVLRVLVKKVETINAELGSLGEVVLERMSRAVSDGIRENTYQAVKDAEDPGEAGEVAKAELGAGARESEIREEIDEAKDLYNKAGVILNLRADALRATLDTALELMQVAPLKRVEDGPEGMDRYVLPDLPSAWQDTLDSLRAPKKRDQELRDWKLTPPQPVCFEPGADAANGAVPLHLSHPFVKRLLARFSTQGFGDHALHRVTAIRNKGDGHMRVIALGRLSLFGEGAARLHDHLVWVCAARRDLKRGQPIFRPFADKQDDNALMRFWELMGGKVKNVSPAEVRNLVEWAPDDFGSLWPHLEEDAQARETAARQALQERGKVEAEGMRTLLQSQMEYLAAKVKERSGERPAFNDAERVQRAQYELDTTAMQQRQATLAKELETEPRDIQGQYRVVLRRLEPVGLIYLCPENA